MENKCINMWFFASNQGPQPFHMRQQRALGNRPQAAGGVVVGQFHPVVHAALGHGVHGFFDFGFALQAVRLQVRDGLRRAAQHIAVRGQDEIDVVFGAGGGQVVERLQVVVHVAIGRVHDGGAAVQDVVAAEQQAVLHQHQAQVVGGVAGGVDDP